MTTHRSASAELRGSMTAMVTPFSGGEVDSARVEELVERQIDGGTDWIVVSGTTGESSTMAAAEKERLLRTVIERSAGRSHIMAGTGSNCTAETVSATRKAADLGAEAVLVVTPYYNRPTQDGLFRHYVEVAKATPLPVVLYNVPFRTGVNLDNDTIIRLFNACPTIVAVKDASGRPENATELRSRCAITVLSGDDKLTWPLMLRGAVGVISVIGNLRPELMKSLVTAALDGNTALAAAIHEEVKGLAEALGALGPNPIPIKTAMAAAGLLEEEFRLPLCPLGGAARARIASVLHEHAVLEPVFL